MPAHDEPLEIGLTLPTRAALFGATTIDEMYTLARAADACSDFEAIWVGDSVSTKARPDAVAFLGALAAITTRIKLAVGCMSSFVLRDPVLFAYQWASLDLISNGRTRLAVCTGLNPGPDRSAMLGIKRSERVGRLEEGMAACRQLWSGERTAFAGKYVRFDPVTIEPRPVQNPCPIWIASNPMPLASNKHWRIALRRVARTADGWMSGQFPPLFGANWRMLAQELTEAGRDPAAFPNVAYHNINVGRDRAACLAETQRFMDAYYGPGVFTPEMVAGQTAAGTPSECADHLRRLADDGVKSVTLRPTSWKALDQFNRLRDDVIPRLTALQ